MDLVTIKMDPSKYQALQQSLKYALAVLSVTPAPTPGPTPTPTPIRPQTKVEHFPGVFYMTDPDPTRGDIMMGQPVGGDPLIAGAIRRYVDAGYNVSAFGPINRKWKAPSGSAAMWGRGRNSIWDSSNGNSCIPPMPSYSPAGFPIHYTVDGSGPRNVFNDPTGKVIGTGTLLHDGKSFSNDAEVLAYIAVGGQVVPPAPEKTKLLDHYGSLALFINALTGYAYAVKLDGRDMHSGFGPPDYFTQNATGGIDRTSASDNPNPGGEVVVET